MEEIKRRRRYGPWAQEDKDFIAQHAENMTVDDIATALDRNPESIKRYIKDTLGLRLQKKGFITKLSAGTNIENTLIWGEIKKEFTEDELKIFLYHWNRIVIQFKEDVYPTEEMQIIDTIKLEILMSRSLKNQKEAKDKIENLQKDILNIKKDLELDEQQFNPKIDSLERQLASQKAAYGLMDKEFNDLLVRKGSLLEKLKATRDQRIKRVEDSRENFTNWMNEILSNQKLRREIGIHMEKFRIALDYEEKRLSKEHQFAEDELDLPLLTPFIIEKLAEENKDDE